MEEQEKKKRIELEQDMSWKMYQILTITACTANLIGTICNFCIHGTKLPTILCGICLLMIVTIGIVESVRIALINDVFGLTGGANGLFGIARPEIFGIKIRKAIQFYYLIWIMVGVTVLLFHWLSESRFGRALNCIKEDDTAAEGCGMDVANLKLMAFVSGAFWAGRAGNRFAAKMTIISPSSFTFWESVVVFAVVILSGGSQIGVLLGTFLIVALPEMFRDFASARMLVFGLAMMIMMVVRPQGLLPPS